MLSELTIGLTYTKLHSKPRVDPDVLPMLFKRISSGDMDALGDLYDQCAHLIYGQALWYTRSAADAADVTQELFFRLAERASELNSVRKPMSYILRITHTLSCDFLRKRKRLTEMHEDIADSALIEKGESFFMLEISDLLNQLPDVQREALYLRYIAGCSFLEVGKITGVTVFTAASRCRIALQKLKKVLGGKK